MSLPDFVQQSNVNLTGRVSGFFGNETVHDNLVTDVVDLHSDVKKWHGEVEVANAEVKVIAEKVRIEGEEIKQLGDIIRLDATDVRNARDETLAARDQTLASEASAIASANSASSDAAKAKLSEEASLGYAHDARNMANNALLSEVEAKRSADLSLSLYEDLRQGQVYRGIWNPHSGAYPDNKGTNSVWDVVLNENEQDYTWNGIKWYWGDRLVYVLETTTYEQLESGYGGAVISVNNHKGAVVLNAADVGAVAPTRKVNNKPLSADVTLSAGDVGALPITGGTINGQLILDNGVIRHRIVQSGDTVAFYQGGHETNENIQNLAFSGYSGKVLTACRTYMKEGVSPFVRWGATDHKVYHQGYKPTAADVGALPLDGGTLTGNLTISDDKNLIMQASANGSTGDIVFGSSPQQGRIWSPNPTTLALSSGSSGSTTGDGSFVISSSNTLRLAGKKVYSEFEKPTTTDVTGLDEALKNAGGSPVLSSAWVQLRTAMWGGYVAADGQLLNRADYPDAWEAIEAGKVPVVSDSDWVSFPKKRGCFTAGNGSTTFRVPDYNGKSANSLGAMFQRGDGLNSAGVSGEIQGDAIRNITGQVIGGTANTYGGPFLEGSIGAFVTDNRGSGGASVEAVQGTGPFAGRVSTLSFNASGVVPTAADNHPVNVTGCWAIKLFGAVQNAGEIDAATLATQLAEAQSKIAELESWPQSGSNANGSWIKHKDGTMICRFLKDNANCPLAEVYGSLFIGNYQWDFPQPFIEAPSVPSPVVRIQTAASWGSVASSITSKYAVLRGLDVYANSTPNATQISAIAIGRWK